MLTFYDLEQQEFDRRRQARKDRERVEELEHENEQLKAQLRLALEPACCRFGCTDPKCLERHRTRFSS